MKLQINGEDRDFGNPAAPFTLSALLETLGMKPDRVAVELNRDIVPRGRASCTRNSLSHPFSTDSLLVLRPSMPKMFETFDLSIVSNISGG